MSSHERVDVGAALAHLGDSVKSFLTTRGITLPVFVGIHTGGVWVAEALHAHCAVAEPLGMLDVSYHRDDVGRTGVRPLKPVRMPASLDNRHVLLIDDVLFTGRTTRAALNELFEYGRPASVSLVVLVERPGREIPVVGVCADGETPASRPVLPGSVCALPAPGEGTAVSARGGAHRAPEVVAQGLDRAEARAGRHLLDGEVGGLGEVTGAGDALPDQPFAGRETRRLLEAPVEGPKAHARAPREVAHAQRFVQVSGQPVEQRGQSSGLGPPGNRGRDELALPPLPMGGQHEPAGDRVGDRGAVVAADDVKAEVEAGGAPR